MLCSIKWGITGITDTGDSINFALKSLRFMAVHKLADDFELSYSLLGIQSGLEDYLLAFRLNQHLGIRLRRMPDSHVEGKGDLPKFEFDDVHQYTRWILVPNRVQLPAGTGGDPPQGLFRDSPVGATRIVLEEYAKIDFVLRIESEDEDAYTNTRKDVQEIPGVRWAGRLDPWRLKTKDLIIF